ncbi:Uncharacterized protein FKW44_020139 [Caligus rogercresseyi]|uniref:Uncharacterized protein n=1 Tax=Caligus rogercresseyi TaxID=217165 RepID=A0A7T8GWX0_CALRO|nr:Uncharacterized protein FKW44_020139 [Caligus rogercresseyi]
MNHKHIFLSESFLTISAAYQFMIDSGLRTLYGTRSSNSVSAHYVCRHNGGTNDPECTYKSKRKKKTEDSLCGGSIRISTKLISRTGVQRVFMVRDSLYTQTDGKWRGRYCHDIRGSQYIQEITLDESAEDELHALLLPCHKCSRVFFSKPSFEEHDCHLFRDPEALTLFRMLWNMFDLRGYMRDFIVYQCSKGVLPDETHLRNKECPAHFTIKSSGGSKVVVVGCIEHSHGVVDKSRNGKDYRAKEENG